jgi:peptide/nickel transport system substrate-binding protein
MKTTRITIAAAALSVSLLAAACSGTATNTATDNGTGAGASAREGSSIDKASHKQGGSLTIANTQGQTWTCQFNPFNPAVNPVSLGFVYEPLVYVNLLQDQKETPMLASSYQWNADKTSIVFTIRPNVKWNDG